MILSNCLDQNCEGTYKIYMFQNALVSCSDKSGLVEFLKPLVDKGLRVVSTGGTSKFLKENGIKVIEVSEQTGFPEVMDGRVRTLHPRIHMALLARSFDPADQNLLKKEGLQAFDLVIGNLYPFEKSVLEGTTGQDLIEEIDIGGPALLRASAKSFERITVLCNPSDYDKILVEGKPDLNGRRKLAAKVFSHISVYDSLVAEVLFAETTTSEKEKSAQQNIFQENSESVDENHAIQQTISYGGKLHSKLRYGENPHQQAFWYKRPAHSGLHDAKILQGKELSYNNILDLEAAVRTCRSFPEPCAVAVKHNNPCGVAIRSNIQEALEFAIKADRVSVFGGIIALNRPVTAAVAEVLSPVFLECVVAPEFDEAARNQLAKKKNLRLLQWDFTSQKPPKWEFRSIEGGILVQSQDTPDAWPDTTPDTKTETWKILGQKPSTEVQSDLLFAWNICQHLKSNAIAVVGGGQTLGLGMGQVNRVDAVRHALERSQLHHGNVRFENLVLASDAFFPFSDSIELAAKAGVKWIIQPGGSVKDEEVFGKARELNITMVITGRRHFKH